MRMIFMVLALLTGATLAQAQSDYRIKAGDTVRVEVLEDPSLNRQALVLPDGQINFPFVGSVRVSGRTAGQVERSIAAGIASNFATDPTVFVSVDSLRPKEPAAPAGPEPDPITIDVYFLGEVNTPGLRPVAPGTDFLQALSQNGGFTRFAATKRVQLRRRDNSTGAQQLFLINYKAIADGADIRNNLLLQDGDVIIVPERRLFE